MNLGRLGFFALLWSSACNGASGVGVMVGEAIKEVACGRELLSAKAGDDADIRERANAHATEKRIVNRPRTQRAGVHNNIYEKA